MWLELDCTTAKVTRATDEEEAWLREYLSFPDARARFRPGNRDATIRMFNIMTGSFPAGLVSLVKRAAATMGYPVTTADQSRPEPVDPGADVAWLRDDQREAVARALSRRRGILSLPTGVGKTELAVAMVRSVPTARWLFLVHRTTLGEQAAERFNRRNAEHGIDLGLAGIVGEGRWEDGEHLTCATFQTLVAKMRKDPSGAREWLARFGGLVCDECFVGSTRVGDKAIELIRVGDLVPSFSETLERFVQRRVLRKVASRPSGLVRVTLDDGRTIVCTPDHRFLADDGWVPAYCLGGKYVLSEPRANTTLCEMQHPAATNDNQRQPTSFLSTMPHGSMGRAAEGRHAFVRGVRDAAGLVGTTGARKSTECDDVLLEGLFLGSGATAIHCHRDSRRQGDIDQDAQTEPYAPSRDEGVGICAVEVDGSPTTGSGWERSRSDGCREDLGGEAAWVGAWVRGPNETTTGLGLPNTLQDRHREPCYTSGGRGRRCVAFRYLAAAARPEEGRVPARARVVRVEVLESGSDGTFGGVCTDGLVYNLVVEGTGTYAVEGVVALNCHTLPADTFWSVAMATANAAYRIGLSGTPLARGDRRSVQAIAALGPVIFRLRADALVAQGILAKPRIRMAILPQESGKPTWQGVYGELVVRSKARNAVLVEMARRCERPGLLFVKEVAHGKAIERALWAAGVRAGFVWGTHSSEYRKAMVRRLERADLDVLVCSVVFQEGIDIPSLRAVIVGSGGRSVIAAIQRVGRGTRIERNAAGEVTKDTFEVWDVADRGQDWMERAAKERRAAYLKEGYEVVEYQDVSPKPKLG